MLWSQTTFESPIPISAIGNEIAKFAENKNLRCISNVELATHWDLKSGAMPGMRSFLDLSIEAKESASGTSVQVKVSPKVWVILTLLTAAFFVFYLIWNAYNNYILSVRPRTGTLSRIFELLGKWLIPVVILAPYLYSLAKTRIIMDLKDLLIPGFLDTVQGRKEMYKSYSKPVTIFSYLFNYSYIIGMSILMIIVILFTFGIIDIESVKGLKSIFSTPESN